MSDPLLSIVIANYNYGRYLEDAIKSVFGQNVGDKVELIICDAASTDNSVDIIKKYADKIAWWCSEKDGGQSEAFNKGFSRARGKYLTWLNADDILVKGCLAKIIKEFELHPECEWFTGNFFRFTEDGNVIEIGWGPRWLPSFLQTVHQPVAVYGPTTFFSKRIYEQVGRIKEDQHFMMDADLWIRFIMAGIKQRRIGTMCWAFRMHSDSKTAEYGEHKLSPGQRAKFEEERSKSLRDTGFKSSKLNSFAIKVWRILDGSFLKRLYLRRTFKRFYPEECYGL